MVTKTLEAAVRIRHRGPAARLAARRGRRPRGQGGLRAPGRAPLLPQGRREVEPGQGRRTGPRPSTATTTPGSTRTATTTTSSPPSTPTTSRCPTTWSGCSATSATRTSASSSARRSTATTTTPSPRPPSRQQFLFHALIQRAGNRYGAPDVRRHQQRRTHQRPSSRSAGCTTRSPRTWPPASRCTAAGTRRPGSKWRSVYTPDVLAVGEGPSAWTDFFTQQMRWSRGTYETILKQYWKALFTLPPGQALQLHADDHLLPDAAAQLDPRRR